jgi:hypothetical protein
MTERNIPIDGKEIDWQNLLEDEMDTIGRFGIFDTKDNVWMGNEQGPLVYEYLLLARVAAQVMECQVFGTDMRCRYKAKPIPESEFRHRDDIATKMSGVEALKKIEEGRCD